MLTIELVDRTDHRPAVLVDVPDISRGGFLSYMDDVQVYVLLSQIEVLFACSIDHKRFMVRSKEYSIQTT